MRTQVELRWFHRMGFVPGHPDAVVLQYRVGGLGGNWIDVPHEGGVTIESSMDTVDFVMDQP